MPPMCLGFIFNFFYDIGACGTQLVNITQKPTQHRIYAHVGSFPWHGNTQSIGGLKMDIVEIRSSSIL